MTISAKTVTIFVTELRVTKKGCPHKAGQPLVNQNKIDQAGLTLPQLAQNLPKFTVPHEHVHDSSTGLGLPQLAQNLPLFSAPQEQVHVSSAGFGLPQLAQNLPKFCAPQAHVHWEPEDGTGEEGAAGAAGAPPIIPTGDPPIVPADGPPIIPTPIIPTPIMPPNILEPSYIWFLINSPVSLHSFKRAESSSSMVL